MYLDSLDRHKQIGKEEGDMRKRKHNEFQLQTKALSCLKGQL